MADGLTADQDDWLLRLYIQPKASLDAWVGLHGDELKVSITAPPIDGKANAYLQKWLAKQFKVAKSQVIIESGAQGRHKRVRIQQGQLPDSLRSFLPEDPLCVT